jgi:CHASE2 domain-containing sensor protein
MGTTSEESLAPLPRPARLTWRPSLSVWQRFMWEWLAIGCFGVAAVFVCVYGGIATNFNRLVYDRMLTLRAQPLAPGIAVVRIDDGSVAEFGRWPWPRTLQARLIDAVAKSGAAAVVYDVLLTEPSPGDDELAQALHSAPTYLPLLVNSSGGEEAVPPVPELAAAAAGFRRYRPRCRLARRHGRRGVALPGGAVAGRHPQRKNTA